MPEEKPKIESRLKSKVDIKGFFEFHKEFVKESDRAAVILGAAKLEYLLRQCLTKFLRPNTASRDELFDGDAPLSTLSAKINLTHRLGLIDPEFVRALHMIRRIRNDFAHEPTGAKLESGPQRDRIKELRAPFLTMKDYDTLKKLFSKKTELTGDFFTALAMMVIRLEVLFDELTPLDTSQEHVLIPPLMKKANA